MSDINEKLDLYEKLSSLQKKLRYIYILIPLAGLLITLVLIFIFKSYNPMIIMIVFISLFISAFIAAPIKKEYSTCYKNLLVRSALQNTFDDYKFYPSLGIGQNEIRFTNMMQLGNRYKSEDYIKGVYKGVPFEQSDVLIQNVTSTGKTTTTVTYFMGRWMIFQFNKDFRCDLQVREKGFSYSKRKNGLFAADDEKLHKIEFEDIDFNNKFSVYGQNQAEAFYLLTPQIMEAMRELQEKTNGRIMFCFVHNKLHVAVNDGKDSFNPPVFKNLDIREECLQINNEINLITRFVDLLNLDKTIYKS